MRGVLGILALVVGAAVVGLPGTALAAVPPAATHAPVSAGPFLTSAPTVTVSSGVPQDLVPWVNQRVVPTIRDWYPVVADALAMPEYAPSTSVTVTVGDFGGSTLTSGTTILIDQTWARASQTDLGAIVHEIAHVVQSGITAPGWLIEGVADQVRGYIYQDISMPVPGPGQSYLDGYRTSAYFLEWMERDYGPMLHDLNVVAHSGGYSDSFFVDWTGKNLDQLWSEMMSRITGPLGQFKSGGKCMTVTAALVLGACTSEVRQWYRYTDVVGGTPMTVRSNGSCLDVSGSGTTVGTRVQMWQCNGSAAQNWVHRANGQLWNPNAGKCVQFVRGTAQLSSCRTITAQKWRFV